VGEKLKPSWRGIFSQQMNFLQNPSYQQNWKVLYQIDPKNSLVCFELQRKYLPIIVQDGKNSTLEICLLVTYHDVM